MEKKIAGHLIRVCRFLLVSLVLWIFFMAVSLKDVSVSWQPQDFLEFLARPSLFFVLNYLNAVLFTLLVAGLFTLLYLYLKTENPAGLLFAVLFVPAYAAINLVVYSSQITLLPVLARQALLSSSPHLPTAYILEMAQFKPTTLFASINATAYVLLGIPSLIFGLALFKRNRYGKCAAVALSINALLCLLGLIGMALENPFLSAGILTGGILFTLAVPCIYLCIIQDIRTGAV